MPAKVLDAWALMGWLQGEEPVTERVWKMFQQAQRRRLDLAMSWINLGEVYYLLAKRHGGAHADQFLYDLALISLRPVVPDERTIIGAARWKSQFPISYADAFALETARQRQARLVTGDPELRLLAERDPLVKLEWVGR
jgi:predicted nucleic acid-binding protein